MENIEQRRIMIDLDSLFDTRLALLFLDDIETMDIKGFKTVMQTGYPQRQSDDWIIENSGISKARWDELWETRGTSKLLSLTKQTLIVKAILDYINDMVNEQVKPTKGDEYQIVINTYPYVLDEETANYLTQALEDQLVIVTNIKTTYMPLEQLTPQYVKDNLDSLWLYDYTKWLDIHLPSLTENPKPTIQLICPKLIKAIPKDVVPDEVEVRILKEFDPFEVINGMLSLFVSIQFVPVAFYSVTREMVASEIDFDEKKEES